MEELDITREIFIWLSLTVPVRLNVTSGTQSVLRNVDKLNLSERTLSTLSLAGSCVLILLEIHRVACVRDACLSVKQEACACYFYHHSPSVTRPPSLSNRPGAYLVH